jgi:UDP-N-acetylmuramoylalanine--D-glutamate ligase
MRPSISWSDLRAANRVGLWGLGTEGSANLRKLRSMGIEPVLVDDRPERIATESVLPTDGQGIDELLTCSVVVKTPGISRYRPEADRLDAAGIAVVGGLGLWLEEADRSRVICITGTKGKSTTTSIVAHLAAGLGLRVFAGGNLGRPPHDPDNPDTAADDVDLWVIETSSYQATDVASTPPVVAVTSLHPDHLPWHGDADTYFRDKLSLCSQPGARITVASAASPLLRRAEASLGPEVRWISPGTWSERWAAPLRLYGEHNLVNAQIARACLEAFGVPGASDDDALHEAARGFDALGSRLELVATVGGVDFIDDSLSTNVLSTLAAVASFPGRRIALIAGGLNRGIDYTSLAEALVKRDEPTLVLTVYSTGPVIQDAIEAVDRDRGPQLEVAPCDDLRDAVRAGLGWAAPDGVVLLSPAAASFDAFDDYRHRSRVFADAIAEQSPSYHARGRPG